MTRVFVGLALVLASLASLFGVRVFPNDEQHPPHRARLTAAYTQDYPDALGAAGLAVDEYLAGVERERQEAEAAAMADVARRNPVRSGGGGVGAGDCAALSEQFGVSASVLWSESRCTTDAYNPTGCGGRGCVGAAQLDAGHFAAVSPWNPSVPGVCYGLDPGSVADQQECARRLPASAWG